MSTREYILGRNPISVMSVQEPSGIALSCCCTRRSILERNLMSVVSVRKHSVSTPSLPSTRESTLEKSRTSVKNARRPSAGALTSSDIRVFTVLNDLHPGGIVERLKSVSSCVHNLTRFLEDGTSPAHPLSSWLKVMRQFYELFIEKFQCSELNRKSCFRPSFSAVLLPFFPSPQGLHLSLA